MAGQETSYTMIKEYKYPKAIIRVYRPDLTETERTKRMNNLKKETERFMKEVIKIENKHQKCGDSYSLINSVGGCNC